jgi:hypothetical protein
LALNQDFRSAIPLSGRNGGDGAAASSHSDAMRAAVERHRPAICRMDEFYLPMPISGQYSGTSSSRMIAVTTERIAPIFSMSLLLK